MLTQHRAVQGDFEMVHCTLGVTGVELVVSGRTMLLKKFYMILSRCYLPVVGRAGDAYHELGFECCEIGLIGVCVPA